jgi:hypothetical protein
VKASKDVFVFADKGNLPGVEKCTAFGANVDKYMDSVREKTTIRSTLGKRTFLERDRLRVV